MPDITSIITQLERQRTAIDNALAALRDLSGQGQSTGLKNAGRSKGNKNRVGMSAEGRQRQIEAMRRYWAAKKTGGKKSATRKPVKKRRLTEAGRKALAHSESSQQESTLKEVCMAISRAGESLLPVLSSPGSSLCEASLAIQ